MGFYNVLMVYEMSMSSFSYNFVTNCYAHYEMINVHDYLF
jgi:hypothetical protein